MDIDTYLQKKAELEVLLKMHGQEMLKTLFSDFFEAAPECKTVTWTQYTPYFNDGDACVFGVNEPSFSSNLPEDIEEMSYYGDGSPEDGWLHTYRNRSDNPAYKNLERKLQEIDTLLESLGDHSQILVANYPDGIKVTVESYDHD